MTHSVTDHDYFFDAVEFCEPDGAFNNEYVYDIEVDDDTHTFIANDILVHNSVYVTFEEIIKSCDWQGDPNKFIHAIYKGRLEEYIQKAFKKYAEGNGTDNIQNLELETIAYSAILLKKKKYCLDISWKAGQNDGIYFAQQQKIKAVGVEIVQSSTPLFARNKLKELLKIVFQEKKKLNMRKLADMLKKEKEAFTLDNIENISMSSSISDFEKGVADDRKKLIFNEHCPMHVRAAGYHNYLVNNSKWKNKYQLIKSGDKIRYYYARNEEGGENVFGYLPGNYPTEIAPGVDYDTQFSKCIIDPLNRFIAAIGLPPLSPELIVRTQLF